MEILSLPENEPFITGIEESIDICFNQIMKLADASIFHCRSGKAHIEIDLQAIRSDGKHPTSASPRQYLQLHLRQP